MTAISWCVTSATAKSKSLNLPVLKPGLFVNPTCGGMNMNKQDYWQLFLETGAPEAYLLYNQAKRMEQTHVSDNKSIGIALDGLQ